MALLLGNLTLVPWQRPDALPTATVAGTWREALGPAPLERLRDRLLAGIDAEILACPLAAVTLRQTSPDQHGHARIRFSR